MYQTASNFRVLHFRSRVLAWIMLAVFCFSFLPSVSLAQQSTATIKTLSGDVLVSGQTVTVGTVLQTGDRIQTQAGASVVLELSDGSEIHLGENTQVNVADLTQTATGERISRLTLLRGWLRAMLSPEHQKEGSSFTVETPNAQIGVKFSQPDVEVSYDSEKQETVGIAHTVELLAKNLLTDETTLVPVGSSVIIIGMIMKVVAGTSAAAIAAGAETAAVETATGVGTGAMIAAGVGAAAAAGGVAAVAASSGDGDGSSVSLTGTFISNTSEFYTPSDNSAPYMIYWENTLELTQTGSSITGSSRTTGTRENCCTVTLPARPVTGTVNGTSVTIIYPPCPQELFTCEGNNCNFGSISCEWNWTLLCTLIDNGSIIRCPDVYMDFRRQ